MAEVKDKDKDKEELPESELLKLQREKYEKIIADKNKIIADLLKNTDKDKNTKSEEDEEDEEEKKKKENEERRKKRFEYYKKNIF